MAGKSNLDELVKQEAPTGQATGQPTGQPSRGITLDEAFAVIQEHVDKEHIFSFAQMNLGIELSMVAIPPEERVWVREIAEINGIPLWQALWGQYRRCQETGLANAPILDPGWSQDELRPLEKRTCPICGKVFQPENTGQIYDRNACGAEAERQERMAKTITEEADSLPVG